MTKNRKPAPPQQGRPSPQHRTNGYAKCNGYTTFTAPFNIACADCGASPGTQCINGVTGQPLRRALAHPGRLRDAEAVADA